MIRICVFIFNFLIKHNIIICLDSIDTNCSHKRPDADPSSGKSKTGGGDKRAILPPGTLSSDNETDRTSHKKPRVYQNGFKLNLVTTSDPKNYRAGGQPLPPGYSYLVVSSRPAWEVIVSNRHHSLSTCRILVFFIELYLEIF